MFKWWQAARSPVAELPNRIARARFAALWSAHAASLRGSAQEAQPLVHGHGKLQPLAAGPIHGAPRVPSRRPVAVPRHRRSLSVGPRRTVHGAVGQHGRQNGSAAGASTHLLPRRTRPDSDCLQLRRRQTSAVVLQPESQSRSASSATSLSSQPRSPIPTSTPACTGSPRRSTPAGATTSSRRRPSGAPFPSSASSRALGSSYSRAKQGLASSLGIDAFWLENLPTTPLSVTSTLSAWIPSG